MQFFIYLLLLSGLAIKIGEAVSSEEIKEYLDRYIESGRRKANKYLKLSDDEVLGQTDSSLVWQGYFNEDTPVAIKIVGDSDLMEGELSIFTALNAIQNENVEYYGIPNVFYYGPIVKKFHGIAMTLFEGTLENYFFKQGHSISYANLLSIFKQMIFALQYLNCMNVVHNDIKPANIFYYGNKFYIGDFGAATHNGAQNEMRTLKFASSNHFAGNPRGPMDDLQSLVFTMWYISGIKMGSKGLVSGKKQEGEVLNELTTRKYIARVDKKLSTFDDNAHVRDAFRYICVDEMLANQDAPDYNAIIYKLDEAISHVGGPSSSSGY